MDAASELARLRWRCRRGMKELDVMLSRYLAEHYPQASADEQQAFRALLDWEDPPLYQLLSGKLAADEPTLQRLADVIRRAPQT